jgi:pyruvyltransferase
MKKSRMIRMLLSRNKYTRDGSKVKKNRVNLEYYTTTINLGDALAPVIFDWMLEKNQVSAEKPTKKTTHLLTVGSLIGGSGLFDATIWGSGIKSFDAVCGLGKRKYFQKFDIRAVRGPLTRQILTTCGYNCPKVYGDPGILMPLIYHPDESNTKREGIGIVQHYLSSEAVPNSVNIKNIDIQTIDYKHFIDQITSCEKIVSSSLHGIILAEAYGIPAVFLAKGRDGEILKYYDWYFSTQRRSVKAAQSIEEAISMEPMPLPDLSQMQKGLLDSFPYDLWSEQ